MSDQSYEVTSPRNVDGSNLINTPGGSGITQINGDATPHQIIAAVSPLAIAAGPPGTETLTVATFTPVARGVVPASGGGTTDFLRADGSWVPVASAAPSILQATAGPTTIPVAAETTIATLSAVVNPGTYLVIAQARCTTLAGTSLARVRIRKNGTAIGESVCESTTGSTMNELAMVASCEAPVTCIAGDLFAVTVEPNAGALTQAWTAFIYAVQLTGAGGGGAGVSEIDSQSGPNATGIITLSAQLDGAVSGDFATQGIVGNTILINLRSFASGHKGVVSDPGVAPASDYLRADNTFGTIVGINGIDIVDAGSNRNVSPPGQHSFLASSAAGIPLVNGALTSVASQTMPAGSDGAYYIGFSTGLNGIAGQLMDFGLRVNGVLSPFQSGIGIVETAAQQLGMSGNAGELVTLVAGDVVECVVNHHGGGADTTSLASSVYGFKVHN